MNNFINLTRVKILLYICAAIAIVTVQTPVANSHILYGSNTYHNSADNEDKYEVSYNANSSCDFSDTRQFENQNHKSANVSDFPKKIIVSIKPYNTIQQALSDEENIDWYHENQKSLAITSAYAAIELQNHLAMVNIDIPILTSDSIDLSVPSFILTTETKKFHQLADNNLRQVTLKENSLVIFASGKNIVLFGTDRIALLHSIYRLLETYGFAWYDPYETHLPAAESIHLVNPQRIIEYPRVKYRGYWMWTEKGYAPDEFAIWLARNRLNLAGGIRPSLKSKLGIQEWGGGHYLITQIFADKDLFNTHPEWYSLIRGSKRIASSKINPSFTNKIGAEYFADKIIDRLANGDLQNIDILNLWPTDSRSNDVWDQSEQAKSVGNHTDNLLYFYSIFVEKLEKAYKTRILKRSIILAGISYYSTWEPPTNLSIVKSLQNKNYIQLFYTNQRSWSSNIYEAVEIHEANKRITDNLAEWNRSIGVSTGIVEYHNYSVFGGVTLDDFEFAANNYEYYINNHSQLFAYMHPLLKNPGPRRLTNILFAQLGWESLESLNRDLTTKAHEIRRNYFVNRYGIYADDWCEVYVLMSRSVQNAKQMFAENSLNWLLLKDIYWAKPKYTNKDVAAFIPRYLEGGTQVLPGFGEDEAEIANFIGLNQSVELQTIAQQKWQHLITQITDPEIKNRIQNDIYWFKCTISRYRILKIMAEALNSTSTELSENELEQYKKAITRELIYLKESPVMTDTISPVNQRLVLEQYLQLLQKEW